MQAEFDPRRRRLTVRYAGFWSKQDCDRILDEFTREIAAASRGGGFTLLEDFTDYEIQSPDIAAASTAFVDVIARAPVRRYAIVVTKVLLKLQIQRQLKIAVDHAFFEAGRAAEDWLSQVEPATA